MQKNVSDKVDQKVFKLLEYVERMSEFRVSNRICESEVKGRKTVGMPCTK